MGNRIGKVTLICEDKEKLNESILSSIPSTSIMPFHSDIISWLSFKIKHHVLVIGHDSEAWISYLVNYVKTVTVILDDIEKGLSIAKTFSDKANLTIVITKNLSYIKEIDLYDYILIRNVIGDLTLEETLIKCKDVLNIKGRIVLLIKNRFSLVRFSQGDIYVEDKQEYLSTTYKNLNFLLSKIGLKYKLYFPYPNALYPLKLFTNRHLPTIHELYNNDHDLISNQLMSFDISKAYDEVLENDMFVEMTNSYFVLLGDMSEYDYVKFSTERKPKFKICTKLSAQRKIVIKRSLDKSGLVHLKNMVNFYNQKQNYYLTPNVCLCPCYLNTQQELVFDYINGENYNEILVNCVNQNNLCEFEEIIQQLFQIISNVVDKKKFEVTDKFIELFGDIEFDGVFTAGNYSNVDMIIDNLIIADKTYITDYEWIFDFPIPHEYILFRTLFFSEAFSKLEKEFKFKIYMKYGINQKDYEKFVKMEEILQDYISGHQDKLAYYKNKLHCRSYNLSLLDENKFIFDTIISKLENGIKKELYYDYSFQTDINIDLPLSPHEVIDILIEPVNSLCILKILDLSTVDKEGNQKKLEIDSHNADVVINEDYFFLHKPEITVKSIKGVKLLIKFKVLKYNDDLINTVVDLLKKNEILMTQKNTNGLLNKAKSILSRK